MLFGRIAVAAIGCAWACTFAAEPAAPWPARPLRVVVPAAPGGGIDAVARITAARLAPAIGQQIIVDDRPGARGVIGVEIVAKAAPDGYTLLVFSDAITVMPFIERKLPFDVRRSFAPISLLATQPLVLAVHTSVPAQSVREFIALAKAKPGALSFGTGAFAHYLAGELLKKAAGFEMTHVPYKGGAPAALDLAGGQVSAVMLGQSPILPFARSGKVRVLAVTSATRSAALPNVPTLAEAGVDGIDLFEWIYMLAPAGTPGSTLSRLNEEIAKALSAADVRQKLEAGGFEPAPGTPRELDRLILQTLERWGKLVPQLNLKPE